MTRLRLTRRMFKRQTIGHTAPGIRYSIGNSFRGLRAMARFGFRWADRDLRKTKDGHVVVTHWDQPALHGERLRAPGIPSNARIESLTLDQVLLLRGPNGIRIHTVEDDIALLGQLRMGAYWEPKAPHSLTLEDWKHIKALCVQHHVKARGYTLRANAAQLPLMHAAGIPAHRLSK